jgi:hypothetical protein
MLRIPRTIAGGILALACSMPVTAIAVAPEPPVGTPVPVTPDKPDVPVTPEKPNVPIVPERDGPPEKPTGSKPPDKTPKKPVVVKKHKPDVHVYPVPTKSNYCPAGLQPVTISGTISCGSPNKTVTYQQMMTHPQKARVKHKPKATYRRSARPTCDPGAKGCVDR